MTRAILATLAALAWALPASAEEASSSPMTAAQMGADLYQNYCATCHGKSAAGDGPLSEYFTTQVPALTQLSANNNGEFPLARVVHLIDGGQQMPFHRGAMPSFGSTMMEETAGTVGALNAEVYTRGQILLIAEYLASIQS
ncbi:cbb3-type cytochrome c oxidase subunit III [Thioclava sp. ES.031]|uniref:c-type cytochrome n=1 Tax=Thioclava sp. ES.031 TaxID=1798203 RepID=UPI000BF4FB7A|nr:cytochrome c [Thioclava sp. ES.031]PFG63154.1 cbb3-type cytochrome c oxidase subunit III [Thioclava sp. ES.031]